MKKLYLHLASSLSVVVLAAQTTPALAQIVQPLPVEDSGPVSSVRPLSEQETLSQVTSVSQLSDVRPTDWAFQALQSLVERYGVIAGYPDGTYRGNRALTRYEFAAGLNAALDRVNELIAAGLADKVSREDLAVLQRLQAEFAAELATLRGRVDSLEARTAELETNQFSTTTKLSGQVILAVNGGFNDEPGGDPNLTFFSRARLNFQTSFSSADLLLTQLQAGSSGDGADDAAEFLVRDRFDQGLVTGVSAIPFEVNIFGIAQQFQVGDFLGDDAIRGLLDDVANGDIRDGTDLINAVNPALLGLIDLGDVNDAVRAIQAAQTIGNFIVASSNLDYSNVRNNFVLNRLSYSFPLFEDFTVAIFPVGFLSDYVDFNSYANNSAADFSTYALINNQLLLAGDLAGAGAALTWTPGRGPFTLRAAYRAEAAALAEPKPAFGGGDDRGGLFGDPNLGVVELEFSPSDAFAIRLQYSGSAQGGDPYNVVGANLELGIARWLALFGRVGYAFNFPGGVQPFSWSAGVAFPDLFLSGALAGIGVSQPFVFQEDLVNVFNATQTIYEVFYRLPVTDKITITPVVQVITDPGNQAGDTILTGTVRAVFAF